MALTDCATKVAALTYSRTYSKSDFELHSKIALLVVTLAVQYLICSLEVCQI